MATTIGFNSNTITQTNEIINNMQSILQFVQNSNVAGEPLTTQQLANLKTRFFGLRDQALALLNSMIS